MNTLELSEELIEQLKEYIKSYFMPDHEICSRKWFNSDLSVEFIGGNEYLVQDRFNNNSLIISI